MPPHGVALGESSFRPLGRLLSFAIQKFHLINKNFSQINCSLRRGSTPEIWRGMILLVEQEVRRLMQAHFSEEMDAELERALASYRRSPGYAPLTRIHPEQIGADGVRALVTALGEKPRSHAESGFPVYVELRAPLRAHLCRHLQRYLIDHSRATEPVLEAYLALEVGL